MAELGRFGDFGWIVCYMYKCVFKVALQKTHLAQELLQKPQNPEVSCGMLCIYGNGILEPKSRPDTRGERKDPCKIGPAPEAIIINWETPKTWVFMFANTPTNMLGNLGFCNTLLLICETLFVAQTSHFHKCNTLQPIRSIMSENGGRIN